LKNEALRHAGCGVRAVDECLARCASDLLGMGSSGTPASHKPSQTQSATLDIPEGSPAKDERGTSPDSLPSKDNPVEYNEEVEDYGGLEQLKDLG
ncbi:hypothetical protein DM02DRAFT_662644, partial [Periconia macrospinosa]